MFFSLFFDDLVFVVVVVHDRHCQDICFMTLLVVHLDVTPPGGHFLHQCDHKERQEQRKILKTAV